MVWLLLAACHPDRDTDGDGLTDRREVGLGLDPERADTDRDGLTDRDELRRGTDPKQPDTDGDGYRDGDEVRTRHDPLDPADRIYEGYWPYNPRKDQLVDPGFDGEPTVEGDAFGRVVGVDPFGQEVDLFDFAGSDVPVVIDATATWCITCRELSDWLAGGDDHADYDDYEATYGDVRAAIDDGRIRWVTYITDQGSGLPATLDDVRTWDAAYPNPRIPVLTDPDQDVLRALNYGTSYYGEWYTYWPSFVVLDGDLRVQVRGFAWDAMDWVQAGL